MTTHVSRTALARVVVDKLLADPSDHASVMREAAAYLLEHGMTSDADALINDVATELFDRTGRLPVEVTSAQPLSDASRQQLVTFLQESTGARVVDLHEAIDETLIGGLVAQTPFAELDVSIRSKLKQLAALA